MPKSCDFTHNFPSTQSNKIYFKQCVAPFYYEGQIAEAVRSYKFSNKLGYARSFAGIMKIAACNYFNVLTMDYIVCVPMDKASEKERGYNQSLILARHLSKMLEIPLAKNMLIKVKKTQKQHHLSAKERRVNLLGAYKTNAAYEIKDKNILVCDDIVTTGSTFNECAKMLKKAGAKNVYCLCIAVNDIK